MPGATSSRPTRLALRRGTTEISRLFGRERLEHSGRTNSELASGSRQTFSAKVLHWHLRRVRRQWLDVTCVTRIPPRSMPTRRGPAEANLRAERSMDNAARRSSAVRPVRVEAEGTFNSAEKFPTLRRQGDASNDVRRLPQRCSPRRTGSRYHGLRGASRRQPRRDGKAPGARALPLQIESILGNMNRARRGGLNADAPRSIFAAPSRTAGPRDRPSQASCPTKTGIPFREDPRREGRQRPSSRRERHPELALVHVADECHPLSPSPAMVRWLHRLSCREWGSPPEAVSFDERDLSHRGLERHAAYNARGRRRWRGRRAARTFCPSGNARKIDGRSFPNGPISPKS